MPLYGRDARCNATEGKPRASSERIGGRICSAEEDGDLFAGFGGVGTTEEGGEGAGPCGFDEEAGFFPEEFLRSEDGAVGDDDGGNVEILGEAIGDATDLAGSEGIGGDARHVGFGFGADIESIGEGGACFRLDGDHLAAAFEPSERATDEAATTDRDEDRIGFEALIFPLKHKSALARDGMGGVISVNLHRAGFRDIGFGGGCGIGIGTGHDDEIGTRALDQGDFCGACDFGDVDAGFVAEGVGGIAHSRAVIAARRGRDARSGDLGGEERVECAACLERTGVLEVFELHLDFRQARKRQANDGGAAHVRGDPAERICDFSRPIHDAPFLAIRRWTLYLWDKGASKETIMARHRRNHPFRDSRQDIETARDIPDTPQTRAPSYKLAFADEAFMGREELRPVRLQLELLKPQLLMDEYGVESTVVLFGGARIPEPAKKATAKTPYLAELSKYYEEARTFARMVTERSLKMGGKRDIVVTGGGPGVMEAGNRGALEAGGISIGLNIVLPHEQAPNSYVTPDLCFNFHYFAIRKMHFLMRANAICVFPGGFGTLDELFESLTLIQTGRMKKVPFILFGKAFWDRIIDWQALAEAGTISAEDLDLMTFVETADEAFEVFCASQGQCG